MSMTRKCSEHVPAYQSIEEVEGVCDPSFDICKEAAELHFLVIFYKHVLQNNHPTISVSKSTNPLPLLLATPRRLAR